MAVGDSNLAGVARVAFEAQTAEFNRDVSVAERTYKGATEGMSDSAIRLELANERLRRSLAKGPSASREQARALLSVRQAERELTQETDRNTRSQERNQRELRQTARGALAGSGAFRGLGRSIAFASGSFLGTAGLVYGIKSALSAASNLNEQTSKTRVVFGQSSDAVIRFSKDALGQAQDQALETASSIGALLRPMGIVESRSAGISVALTKLGTDLSSFYNTSVQDALDAIRSGLVGEIEPLRRYGVILSAAKVEQAAMAATGKTNAKSLTDEEKALARVKIILESTTLAHGDYQRTLGGVANQEREAQKNWRNTQILLGETLQPTYNEILHSLNDWLGEQKNQERIQRDVNEVVKAGVGTFKAIKGVIEDATTVVSPLVDKLGGIENTLKLLAGAWVVFKAKGVLGFTATAASSRIAATKMVADATMAGRAWDIATRPRVMTVTTVGGGGTGPGVPTPTGPTTTTGRGVTLPGTRGTRGTGLLGLASTVGLVAIGLDIFAPPSKAEQQRAIADMSRTDPKRARAMAREYASKYGTSLAELTVNNPLLKKYGAYDAVVGKGIAPEDIVAPGEGRPAPGPLPKAPRGGGATTTTGRATAAPRRTIADIQLDIDRARTTPGTADEERYLKELQGRYNRQIAFFEAIKNRTKTQRATLSRLYGELAAVQGELEGYQTDREQALEKQRQDAHDKRVAQRKKHAAAEKARQAKALAAALDDARSISKGAEAQLKARFPMGTERLKRIDPTKLTSDGKSDLQKALDARATARDILAEQRRLFAEFAGNVMTGGAPGTAPATVIVNQHFKAPTLDRHREARLARIAAKAQFT